MASQVTPPSRSPSTARLDSDDMSTAATAPENDQTSEKLDKYAEASTTQAKEPEYIQGFKLFNVLAALTLVTFLMLLDATIVVAAAPRITDDFQSFNDLGWYGAAYQLGR